MIHFFAAVSFFAVASTVSALSIGDMVPILARNSIVARHHNISTVPAQCTSGCSSIYTTLNACGASGGGGAKCVCTSANGQALEACADCIVGAGAASVGDTVVSEFNTECAARSVSVAAPTASASTGSAVSTASTVSTVSTVSSASAVSTASTVSTVSTVSSASAASGSSAASASSASDASGSAASATATGGASGGSSSGAGSLGSFT
ncbi:hypothetical protein FIBSPDRAFT_878957, partial [Athelia psychrophila]